MESSRRTIAYFSRLPHYSSLFTQEGFASEVSALKEAWQSNDAQRAMRAVSDEMALTLSAAGTADDVAARISALLKAGLKQAGAVSSRGGWRRQWRHPPDDRGPIMTEALENPV